MVSELLEIYGLEELLERCDITPEEVIEILIKHGYITLDDYRFSDEEQDES
jgi:hypothetical protein